MRMCVVWGWVYRLGRPCREAPASGSSLQAHHAAPAPAGAAGLSGPEHREANRAPRCGMAVQHGPVPRRAPLLAAAPDGARGTHAGSGARRQRWRPPTSPGSRRWPGCGQWRGRPAEGWQAGGRGVTVGRPSIVQRARSALAARPPARQLSSARGRLALAKCSSAELLSRAFSHHKCPLLPPKHETLCHQGGLRTLSMSWVRMRVASSDWCASRSVVSVSSTPAGVQTGKRVADQQVSGLPTGRLTSGAACT